MKGVCGEVLRTNFENGSVDQIPCIQETWCATVWRMVLAVMMITFTRKYVDDMVRINGLNEGMFVGLDQGTCVSRGHKYSNRWCIGLVWVRGNIVAFL